MSASARVTVRMLTQIAGSPSYEAGDLATVAPVVAVAWVAAGLAAWPDDEPPETAMVAAPERAVVPRARARRG